MIAAVSGKEFQAVIRLSPAERYEYFVKKVADWAQVWGLWHEGGWAILGDQEGGELVPVWPHPIYAEAYAIDDWLGYQPKSIILQDWLGKWTPGMEKDGRMVAVFPSTEGKSAAVSPQQLKSDLEEELSKYE